MSKFFTPVDFPELKKPVQNAEIVEDIFPIEITPFIVTFQRLIRSIESGESGISKPLNLKNSPIQTALERLGNSPSKNSLLNFLKILEQEVNSRAKQEAIQILKTGNKKLEDYLKKVGL